MILLIFNEWKKIFHSKMKWIFFALIVGTIGLALTFSSYTMDNNQNHNFLEFMYNVSFFKITITIFTISVGATIFSNEFSTGTIKYLLIRPISRLKIFFAKLLTVLLIGILMMACILILSFIVGAILYGFDELDKAIDLIKQISVLYLSEIAQFASLSCFAIMLSIFFRNSAFSLGVSFAVLFCGPLLTQILKILQENWAKYLLFSNLDLTQYISGNEPIFMGMSATFSSIIILIHIISFIFVGIFFFKKRDVLS